MTWRVYIKVLFVTVYVFVKYIISSFVTLVIPLCYTWLLDTMGMNVTDILLLNVITSPSPVQTAPPTSAPG